MNGKNRARSCGYPNHITALVITTLLAAGFADYGAAAPKTPAVDYSPVRVRVRKPVAPREICPRAFSTVTYEEVPVMHDGKQVYDGKQVEVRRQVLEPADEMPAWECVTVGPRFRPCEGPHGRVSAGVIFRDFGEVKFRSRSMLTEDLNNEAMRPPGFPRISPGGLFEVDEGDYWREDVDGAGPYVAFDLLFPINPWFSIGQQVSFSFVSTSAGNNLSNLSGNLDGGIRQISERADAYMHNHVTERLDADVYTLSLGPLAEVHAGPVFLQGAFGLAINLVHFDADVREKVYIHADFDDPVYLDAIRDSGPAYLRDLKEDEEVLAENLQDGNNGTKFLFGFYVQGLLGFQIAECWSVAGFVRYDWNDNLEGEVGYSDFSMDMSAFSLGAQIGFNF